MDRLAFIFSSLYAALDLAVGSRLGEMLQERLAASGYEEINLHDLCFSLLN